MYIYCMDTLNSSSQYTRWTSRRPINNMLVIAALLALVGFIEAWPV